MKQVVCSMHIRCCVVSKALFVGMWSVDICEQKFVSAAHSTHTDIIRYTVQFFCFSKIKEPIKQSPQSVFLCMSYHMRAQTNSSLLHLTFFSIVRQSKFLRFTNYPVQQSTS